MNLTERVPLVDIKFFVTAVMLQRETGGNLAEILDNLSYVIRERFKIQRQVRVRYRARPAHDGVADGHASRRGDRSGDIQSRLCASSFLRSHWPFSGGGQYRIADDRLFCDPKNYQDPGLRNSGVENQV